MEIRNCSECDKIFAYINVNICPACLQAEEEEFKVVKEYLYKHPQTGIYDLAEATQVEEHKILRWLKAGRLEGKRFASLAYPCESCGRNIQEGRFCLSCSNELAKVFSKATTPKRDEDNKRTRAKFHSRD